MERRTFSNSWSRVSRLTPTLRSHAQIHRQLYHGEPWHVVHDPLANQFFRLNPVAYHLVGLLDGKRSVDDVWRLTLDRYGDSAPTQDEVIGLLSQLNQANLLRVDLPPDAEPLLRRQRQRKLQYWGGQAMSVLFLRLPIFNPDPILRWLSPLFRPLLSVFGLMVWFVWVGFATLQLIPHFDRLTNDVHSVLAPKNWPWMAALFVITKLWHEMGHGLVCRRFGGSVPEIGIMMLVLFPFPYVDATSSWNFPQKSKRFLVAAAGMIFELAIAAGAALIWIDSEPDSLARQLSYNVIFMTSVATLLFNANPLLRYDGYYMLSDLLEIPNLYDRSKKHLQYLVQRYAYGMKHAQPVSTRRREQVIMTLYGILSAIYRVVILGSILLFIAGQLFTLGLLLAAWSLIAWLLFPLGKFIRWLATSPALHEHRARAVTVTVVFALVVGLLIGAIPVPDRRLAHGVVESRERTELAVQTPGFATKVLVEAGDQVKKGDVILLAENPELEARYKERLAQREQFELEKRQAQAENQVDVKAAIAKIEAVSEEITDLERRLEELTLRSPQDGVVVGAMMSHWMGQYLQRGQVVARIEKTDDLRVTCLVEQAHNANLFDGTNPIGQVELRVVGRLDKTLNSQLLTPPFPSGRSSLPHPALGYRGGGDIATKPDDPHGQETLQPQFELWLSLPQPAEGEPVAAYPGQRVYVRLTLEKHQPLVFQWTHRLMQILRDRLSI